MTHSARPPCVAAKSGPIAGSTVAGLDRESVSWVLMKSGADVSRNYIFPRLLPDASNQPWKAKRSHASTRCQHRRARTVFSVARVGKIQSTNVKYWARTPWENHAFHEVARENQDPGAEAYPRSASRKLVGAKLENLRREFSACARIRQYRSNRRPFYKCPDFAHERFPAGLNADAAPICINRPVDL